MGSLTVQFVGAGDAFGSGGRFQTCISLRAASLHVLLDCGATSLVALRRLGLDPGTIDAVLLSHLHGDHFGGVPFLVLDAQFGRRERPLLVAGPPGTAERVTQAMEVLFPASSRTARRFELRFVESEAGVPTPLDFRPGEPSPPAPAAAQQSRAGQDDPGAALSGVAGGGQPIGPAAQPTVGALPPSGSVVVTAYPVVHASGAPAYALRVDCAGKTVTYSGDTEWTDALLDAARDADLFICESYFYEKVVKYHLAYATLRDQRARLTCRRLILTHPSADLLAHRAEIGEEIADDGLTVSI
jgi:ribonuclease BN (tRNA processing enzyme)